MLLDHMAQHARQAEKFDLAKMLARKSEESKQHADVLRKAAFTQAALNTGQLDERDLEEPDHRPAKTNQDKSTRHED